MRKHIIISDQTDKCVKEYMEFTTLSYSKALNELVVLGNKNNQMLNEIKNNEDTMKIIINKLNLNFDLLKQFYSDMGIVGLSNPKNCKNLQNFFNNRKKNENG